MRVKPIMEARFLDNYVLEVVSDTNSVVRLNMKPFLHTTRFLALKDVSLWKTGTTDGISVIWDGVAEMSYEEITRRAFW
jgi:hypothetical protein